MNEHAKRKKRTRFKATAITLLVALVTTANATVLVFNPVQTSEQVTAETRNFIQWTETQVSTLNTEINIAKSLLYQGNPGAVTVPELSSVQGLAGQIANSQTA
jgi:hypothetical protein